MKKLVDAWAEKNKVEVQLDFLVVGLGMKDQHHHGGRGAGQDRP